MGRRRKDRGELVNDPMSVEIRGESFNYPADITVDRDGSDLETAIGLLRKVGAQGIQHLLGSDKDVEESWRVAKGSGGDKA